MAWILEKLHRKTGIILPTMMLVLSIIELASSYILSYNQGLTNFFLPVAAVPCCLVEPLKIAILIYTLARLVCPKHDLRPRQYLFAMLLCILIFAGSWVLGSTSLSPVAGFLKGCEEWIDRNVDVDAIQTWLMSDEADAHMGQHHLSGNLRDNLPHFVTDFDPKYIVFYGRESDEERSLKFEWGGALNHWGFVVGLPTMKASQKGRFRRGGSVVEYRRPIKPGVYVYNAG